MSAVYLKLTAVLCLSCTALSGLGSSGGVVRREFGDVITIQCRCPEQGPDSLSLQQGLTDKTLVLFKDGKTEKANTAKEFSGRLELNGVFPDVDIVIKNLTADDTGTYWCMYMKFDRETHVYKEVKGSGSVLLVVTADTRCDDQSDSNNLMSDSNNLILVSVVICAATLLGIIICFLIWIILKTQMCTAKKPRRVPNNDVYEEMRGGRK